MVKAFKASIIDNRKILPDFYRLELSAFPIAKDAVPGQFVMVGISDTFDPFLKRPFSINRISKENGTITIIYQVVGRGTRLLSQKTPGEKLEIIGPLGQGFSWSKDEKTVAVVGGGCGVAPLLALTEDLVQDNKNVYVIIGSQTKEKLFCEREFISLGCKVEVVTDDGSYGRKGVVTNYFQELIDKTKVDKVFGCGPRLMIKSLVQITNKLSIPCQVSLEERMGCGLGVCLGCATKIKNRDGNFAYKKVCQDGPVFQGNEVVFDD